MIYAKLDFASIAANKTVSPQHFQTVTREKWLIAITRIGAK